MIVGIFFPAYTVSLTLHLLSTSPSWEDDHHPDLYSDGDHWWKLLRGKSFSSFLNDDHCPRTNHLTFLSELPNKNNKCKCKKHQYNKSKIQNSKCSQQSSPDELPELRCHKDVLIGESHPACLFHLVVVNIKVVLRLSSSMLTSCWQLKH